jgi:hypothetical protein
MNNQDDLIVKLGRMKIKLGKIYFSIQYRYSSKGNGDQKLKHIYCTNDNVLLSVSVHFYKHCTTLQLVSILLELF